MRSILLFVAALAVMLSCQSCDKEVKGFKDEIKLLREENNFLKAENIGLKKEIEELYKRLDEKIAAPSEENMKEKTEPSKDGGNRAVATEEHPRPGENSKIEDSAKKKP